MTKSNNKVETQAGVELSRSEIEDAKKEGALEYVKDGATSAMAADTGTAADIDAVAESQRLRVAADLHSTTIAPLLDLSQDELSRRLGNENVIGHIDFETAKGLLHLERSGRNRTGYVKMLCARIGVDDPREVTHAGPSYTNDETNLNHL